MNDRVSWEKYFMNIEYEGWELDDFDSAKNYRSYQFDLISSHPDLI